MYYEQTHERSVKWFALSIGVHLLLIFVFIDIERPDLNLEQVLTQEQLEALSAQALQQQNPQLMQQQEQAPTTQDDEVPFFLNMKDDSTFGATVIFQELAEMAASDAPTATPQEKEKELEQSAITEDAAQHEEDSQDTTTEEQIAETVQDINQTITPTQPQEMQPAVPQPAQTLPRSKPRRKRKPKTLDELFGAGSRTASPITHNLTLTRLAEGFVNYAHEHKGEVIDINTHDLKYTGYMQRIGWFLQNSFHLNNKPITLDQNIQTNVVLHLDINEDGSLHESILSPMTGARGLDDILLKIARGAAPFPPLPKHLNRKNLKIKLPIHISAAAGTHSYYFVFKG